MVGTKACKPDLTADWSGQLTRLLGDYWAQQRIKEGAFVGLARTVFMHRI